MSVGRICIRDVDLADADELVWRAAERMHQRAVGTLVVLNKGKEPIGIVTDRDLVERVLAVRRDANIVTVAEVMTHDPATIDENASIESALSLMRDGAFRRLPVVDDEGKLVGLLSLDDVLALLADELAAVGRLLERQTPLAAAEV
jgi:CBS domain-containing protein